MKILITKKYTLNRIGYCLLHVSPAKFSNVVEVEKASKIIDIIKEKIENYIELIDQVDAVNSKYEGINNSNPQWVDYIKEISAINKQIKSMEGQDRQNEMTIEFENDEFNHLFQFFENWGREWFMKIDEFLQARKDMTDCNSRLNPKKDKK